MELYFFNMRRGVVGFRREETQPEDSLTHQSGQEGLVDGAGAVVDSQTIRCRARGTVSGGGSKWEKSGEQHFNIHGSEREKGGRKGMNSISGVSEERGGKEGDGQHHHKHISTFAETLFTPSSL